MKTFLRQTFIVMLMAFGALAAVVICLDAAGVSENSLLPGIGFSNSGPAGGFVSLSLVATVCLWLDTGKRTVLKTILPFLAVLLCVALVLSNSRAAWLAAVAGLTLPLLGRLRSKQIKLFLCFFVILIAGLYLLRPESANGRILIWRVCAGMIADKPLFGYGPNGLVRNYMPYQAEFFEHHPNSEFISYADNNVYAFNELLHISVDWGAVGVVVICLLVFSRLSSRSTCSGNSHLKAVLTSWLVFAMFSYPLSQAPLFVVFLLCCILMDGRYDSKRIIRKLSDAIAVTVLLCGTMWFVIGWTLDRKIDGLYAGNGSCSRDEELFQPDNLLMKFHPMSQGQYVAYCEQFRNSKRENAILSSIDDLPLFGVYCAAGDILSEKGEYENAILLYDKASLMIPLRLRPRYAMFLIMLETERFDEAREIGEEMLALPIKVRGSDSIIMLEDVRRKLFL